MNVAWLDETGTAQSRNDSSRTYGVIHCQHDNSDSRKPNTSVAEKHKQ